MIGAIKKTLGIKPEAVKQSHEAPPGMAALQASLNEQSEQMVVLASQLAEASQMLAQANEKIVSLEVAKAAAEETAEQLKASAHKSKMDARLAALEANLGTEKAPALMSATEGMDDEQFAAICSALGSASAAEAGSELFKEVGVETKAEANAEVKPTHFNNFIRK